MITNNLISLAVREEVMPEIRAFVSSDGVSSIQQRHVKTVIRGDGSQEASEEWRDIPVVYANGV